MNELKKLVINGQEYTVTDSAAVAYGREQVLTEEEKTRARQNIGAGPKIVAWITVSGRIPMLFEEGMTWGEYCASRYNYDRYACDEQFVYDQAGDQVAVNAEVGEQVNTREQIVPFASYGSV